MHTHRRPTTHSSQWMSTLPLLGIFRVCRPRAKPKLIVRKPWPLGDKGSVAVLHAPPSTPLSGRPSDGNGWNFAEDEIAIAGALLDAAAVDFERKPRPPRVQLTSMPRLMPQSQTSTKTGVLTRTLRTGKMSGRRGGGENKNSTM